MSRVLEASFKMHNLRTDLQKWLAEYVRKAHKANCENNGMTSEPPMVDFDGAGQPVILDNGLTVYRAYIDSFGVADPASTSMRLLYSDRSTGDLITILEGLEEYLIKIEELAKPNWIPATQCKEGHIYFLDSRNLSYGRFDVVHTTFYGIRHKFGDEFIDCEEHYDTGMGSAKPLKEYGAALGIKDKELMDYLKKVEHEHYEADKPLLL